MMCWIVSLCRLNVLSRNKARETKRRNGASMSVASSLVVGPQHAKRRSKEEEDEGGESTPVPAFFDRLAAKHHHHVLEYLEEEGVASRKGQHAGAECVRWRESSSSRAEAEAVRYLTKEAAQEHL
jgi:hypothetical protein